jgi:hypothetical protein
VPERPAQLTVPGVGATLLVVEPNVLTSNAAVESRVAPALIAAYRATHFCVAGVSPPFILKVDEANADLAQCHRAHGVDCSAFITAWNPGSQPTAQAANEAAQQRLLALLNTRRYRLLPGLGVDPAGQWEGEESVLVLGIDRPSACEIGREFRQHGIVWAGADAVPRLVMLQ